MTPQNCALLIQKKKTNFQNIFNDLNMCRELQKFNDV
jgi:hypothetical protein